MTHVVWNSYVSAYIEDQPIPEVLSVRCKYALNQIPELEIRLPLGLRFDGETFTDAPMSEFPVFGNRYIPITVFLNDRLLFDGFIAAIQTFQSAMHAQRSVVIHARHWLDLLNAIPIVSESSHPSNPFSFMCRPVEMIGSVSGVGQFGGFVGNVLLKHINDTSIHTDFWGALRSVILEISSRDFRPAAFGLPPIPPSPLALAILSRLVSPVPIRFPMFAAGSLARAIRIDLGMSLFGQYLTNEGEAGLSIGTRLFSIVLPNYLLDFVPFPDKCLIVPSWPSAAVPEGSYFRIGPDVQISQAGVYAPQRPIAFSGVYVVGPHSLSGLELKQATKPIATGYYYSVTNPNGVFIFRRASGFLNFLPQSLYAHIALPVGRPAQGQLNPDPKQFQARQLLTNSLANGLAYYNYCAESVSNRSATLVCAPDPNIPAPGTIVEVGTPPDAFYGRVQNVEIAVSFEGQAGTASIGIALTAVRNWAENQSHIELYNPVHPWYGLIEWTGETLIK